LQFSQLHTVVRTDYVTLTVTGTNTIPSDENICAMESQMTEKGQEQKKCENLMEKGR